MFHRRNPRNHISDINNGRGWASVPQILSLPLLKLTNTIHLVTFRFVGTLFSGVTLPTIFGSGTWILTSLFLLGRPLQITTWGSVISNRIEVKFGRIVLQVNTYRCQLMSAHAASARRICSRVLQFLFHYSTFMIPTCLIRPLTLASRT